MSDHEGSSFAEQLAQRPMLLDGGMGTLLIAKGLKTGQAPEGWNLEHPDRVAEAHRAYIEAGSDIIHANTFGGTEPKLASLGLGGRCAEVNTAAVRIAREASDGRALVAGDVGPTGGMLPPMGKASEEQLRGVFAEQVDALANAGVDLISIETMYDLREARAALAAALAAGLPVIVSLTFDVKRRGYFTIVGDRIGPSFSALLADGAAAVGFNCTVDSTTMLGMVREAAAAVGGPILAQPNAGKPHVTPAGVTYPDANPGSFADDLAAMVCAGARLVGGCCGTDPTYIAMARKRLDEIEVT